MVGPIKKIPMQANLNSPTGSSIKIYGWSGVRFSIRFLYFGWSYRNFFYDILVHLHIKFFRWSGVRFSVRFPVFVLLMVVSMYFSYTKISFVLLIFLSEFIVLKRIFRLVFQNENINDAKILTCHPRYLVRHT